jgi:hypothetical protein
MSSVWVFDRPVRGSELTSFIVPPEVLPVVGAAVGWLAAGVSVAPAGAAVGAVVSPPHAASNIETMTSRDRTEYLCLADFIVETLLQVS